MFPNGLVTFLSLDVEGSEAYVVENIDFKQVNINIMIIYWILEQFIIQWLGSAKVAIDFVKWWMMQGISYICFTKIVKQSDLFIHTQSKYLNTLLEKPEYKAMNDCFMRQKKNGNAIPRNAAKLLSMETKELIWYNDEW